MRQIFCIGAEALVAEYIRRFRDTKNRCYSLIIFKKNLAELALNGLRSHIKENLEGVSAILLSSRQCVKTF